MATHAGRASAQNGRLMASEIDRPNAAGTDLRIDLFGATSATVEGRPVDLGPRKQRAVLAVLALSAGRLVSIDRLTDAIWGDEPPAASRNALQVYVAAIRRALPDGSRRLRTADPGYLLDLDPDAVDVLRFERLLEAPGTGRTRMATLEVALNLWTGDPLADLLDLPFADPVVARLRELRMRGLEDRIDGDLEHRPSDAIATEIETLLIEEPYRERLWRQLMLARYRAGRQADALAAFRKARRLLRDDLGLEPGPALVALERAILMQDPALDVAPEPTAPTTLPALATPTVGRSTAIAEVTGIVRTHRLTSIVGPGGVGKTRLAIEVGRAAASWFPDGVAFVDLSAVRESRAFVAQLAQAVGAESSQDDVAAIRFALDGQRMLVVLDNTEQWPDAGEVIAGLLGGTDGPHLLVTTRVVLRAASERVYPLVPLDPPDAAALFAQRVLAATGSEPGDSVAAAIAARLDGLPLALELAAASCRVFGPADILSALAERLPLPSGPRDVPERQRTLRGMVAWSLDLLSAPERRMLAGLTILRSPFTLDAVSSLLDHEDGPASADIRTSLAGLVESSLVVHDHGRYRILQPIRDVAEMDLDVPTAGQLRDRHADWIVRATASGAVELYHGDERASRARLLALIPDMRAAFEHLLAADRAEEAARIVLDVAQVWFHAGRLHEAEARLGRVVDRPGLTDRTRAEAIALRGVFAKMTGNVEAARVWIAEGLVGLRTLAPDSIALVNSLCHLADLRVDSGDTDEAVTLADEAVAAARRTDDDGTISMALDLAGHVARSAGDRDRAIEAARGAVTEGRRRQSFLLADALAGLAASLGAGDPTAAEVAWEALALAESGGQPNQQAKVIITVAEVLGAIDPARTGRLLADALATYLAVGVPQEILVSAVAIVRLPGSPPTSAVARLLGAIGRRSDGRLPDGIAPIEARVRQALGPAGFAEAYGAGAALDDDALSRLGVEVADLIGGWRAGPIERFSGP